MVADMCGNCLHVGSLVVVVVAYVVVTSLYIMKWAVGCCGNVTFVVI